MGSKKSFVLKGAEMKIVDRNAASSQMSRRSNDESSRRRQTSQTKILSEEREWGKPCKVVDFPVDVHSSETFEKSAFVRV
jgi:hypothetical protein